MNKPFYSVALRADAQTVAKVNANTSKSAQPPAGNLATPQTGLAGSRRDPTLPPATRAALAGHDAAWPAWQMISCW